MSIAIWPQDLPQRVLADGYQEGVRDGRLVQAMDKGPPKMRRRTSAAVKPVQAAMVVDFNGRARFERFWNDDTAGGVLPFYVRDQALDSLALGVSADGEAAGPLLTAHGAPVLIAASWLCQFAEEPPSVTAMDGIWFRISFGLLVLP